MDIAGADGESAEERESRSKARNSGIIALRVILWLVIVSIVIGVVIGVVGKYVHG